MKALMCVPHSRHCFSARHFSFSSTDFWFLLVIGSRYVFEKRGMVVIMVLWFLWFTLIPSSRVKGLVNIT